MLNEIWNPARPTNDEYIAFLNVCFGGSWNERLFRWYLAREFAGRKPDRLVMFRDDVPVAGSTVNYRQLRMPDGDVADIGIASGSWTVPAARGQGHFSRMMLASAERAGQHGCRFFLAFVTADNASSGALERCGAVMRNASYLVSVDEPRLNESAASWPVAEAATEEASPFDSAASTDERILFHYRNSDDWRAQIVSRPDPTSTLSVGPHLAVIENVDNTDRLQWTSAPVDQRAAVASALARRSAASGRRFFMYGSGGWTAACADSAGLVVKPGYIAILPAAGTRMRDYPAIAAADWDVQSGDRL